jgi:hypothetical protein
LPPQVGFHVGIGLGAAHIGVDIAPQWYSFVEERHILAPRVRSYFAPPARNVQLVNVTKNVTNVTVVNNRVVDRSIDVKNIERVTKRPVTVHRIVEVDSRDQVRGSKVRDKDREVVLARPDAVKRSREDNDRREQEQARDRRDNDRREQEQARDRRNEDGKSREDRNDQQLSERQRQERTANEERQRQERQSREETAAEESRKRQETAREEARAKARRQQQELQQQQANERRKQELSGTAADREDKPTWQQQPSSTQQQAPSARTTEDTEPRSQRQRRKQPYDEQGTEQRRYIPPSADHTGSSRDRQSVLTEPQRSNSTAQPNTLSPEEHRERQGATQRTREERRNKKRMQRQTQEEQYVTPYPQGTTSN